MAHDTQRVKSAGQRPKEESAPAEKKVTKTGRPKRPPAVPDTKRNALARKWAGARRGVAGLIEQGQFGEVGLGSAAEALIVATTIMRAKDIFDYETRLMACRDVGRLAARLCDLETHVLLKKRLEALEAQANAK